MPIDSEARVAVYIDFDNIVMSWYDRVHGRNSYSADRQKIIADPDEPTIAQRLKDATIDVGAITANVRHFRRLTDSEVIAVVKADGYGHGMVEVAAAARDAGADWLGVATIEEALALRAAGDHGPLLCWLSAPGDDFAAAVHALEETS